MSSISNKSLHRALSALEGLSVGDAFGSFFEFASTLPPGAELRKLPKPPWRYTDDTSLALSVFSILRQYGEINQDMLAQSMADHLDRSRGYGLGTRGVLTRIKKGVQWREAAYQRGGGTGSYGNVGVVHAGMVGVYFAQHDYPEKGLNKAIEQACLATEVTHAHQESLAGAIAVAVAGVVAWHQRESRLSCHDFLNLVLPYIPKSTVRDGIKQAKDLPTDATLQQVVHELGNGSRVTVQDTVPFAMWCIGNYLYAYETAIQQVARAGGDVDTVCAIVGSVVAISVGKDGIPVAWQQSREALPEWALL